MWVFGTSVAVIKLVSMETIPSLDSISSADFAHHISNFIFEIERRMAQSFHLKACSVLFDGRITLQSMFLRMLNLLNLDVALILK